MKTLDGIGSFFGTDKSSLYHGYLDWYEEKISQLEIPVNRVLEIGVKDGASIRMWKSFLGINSIVIGVDNAHYIQQVIGTIYLRCDAYNGHELPELLKGIEFDLVIDDGSHRSADQIRSFYFLYGKVRKGGILIMEDIHTSFLGDYTPPGQQSFYDWIHKEGLNTEEYWKDPNNRADSGTMIIYK